MQDSYSRADAPGRYLERGQVGRSVAVAGRGGIPRQSAGQHQPRRRVLEVLHLSADGAALGDLLADMSPMIIIFAHPTTRAVEFSREKVW